MRQDSNKTGRVLAVDDEPRNIRILEELLEEHQLETASSGEECLQMLETFVPDVVLLDVMMPGLDGYEVCRRIKSDTRLASTKVLLVSGKAMLEERLQGYEAGADDYITKPFDMDELLAKVDVFLRLRTAEAMNSIKKNFLALLSHESRTPLNHVIGFSSLILEDKDLPMEEVHDMVALMKKSGEDFLKLTEKILRLCELKDGSRVELGSYNLKTLVELCVDRMVSNVELDSQQVEVGICDCELELNSDLMEEALSGVLADMTQPSEEGKAFDHKVYVKGKPQDGSYILEFCVDNAKLDGDVYVLFDENTSMAALTDAGIKHLDLSIARSICELHGGALSVESSESSGITVKMVLPVG